MFIVLNRANLVIAITTAISYAKHDASGATVRAEAADASAIYAADDDKFYPVAAAQEWGVDAYHAAEVATVPAEVVPGFWYYADKAFFTTAEKRETLAAAEAQRAAPAAAAIAFVTLAEAGQIDAEAATENAEQFAAWAYPVPYAIGNIRRHADRLYKCVQAHTSQVSWAPDTAASLWSEIGNPAEEWPAWRAPVGAHDAYAEGAKVTHKAAKWVSTAPANVWEPGAYGWTAAGTPATKAAEPVATPNNAVSPMTAEPRSVTAAAKPTLKNKILTAIKGEK